MVSRQKHFAHVVGDDDVIEFFLWTLIKTENKFIVLKIENNYSIRLCIINFKQKTKETNVVSFI